MLLVCLCTAELLRSRRGGRSSAAASSCCLLHVSALAWCSLGSALQPDGICGEECRWADTQTLCRDRNSLQIPAHLLTRLHGASLSRSCLSQKLGRSLVLLCSISYVCLLGCFLFLALAPLPVGSTAAPVIFLEKGLFGCYFLPQSRQVCCPGTPAG